jgi:predicted phosphoribosyltransferase
VAALHGGVSNRKPTIKVLHWAIKKRQSSYSHSVLSMPGGGLASSFAVSRLIGVVWLDVW